MTKKSYRIIEFEGLFPIHSKGKAKEIEIIHWQFCGINIEFEHFQYVNKAFQYKHFENFWPLFKWFW